MKKNFFSISKQNNIEVIDYKSERSDMGTQMFTMTLKFQNGKTKQHTDSYFVGEKDGREKVLKYFQETILDAQSVLADSFLCALATEKRCKKQCFTCYEDQKCDEQHTKNLR